MATSLMSRVLEQIRRAAPARNAANWTDGQLLTCFVDRHDETAFAALLGRHGPMVWGVCRRILGSEQDAEDAFQASFLVLARKAATVASRELLANWLYGVAHRTALKARAAAVRRRLRERPLANLPEPQAALPGTELDALPLLDQELSRLADKYRAPVVLCDLEGKTRAEAARQLGVPEGTVAGRLARARQLLAKRLSRRGVAGAVVAGASPQAVPACVTAATLRAACGFAFGQAPAAVSAGAAALARAVLRSLWLTRLKAAAACVLGLTVAVLAGGEWARQHAGASPEPVGQAAATAPRAGKRPGARAVPKLAPAEKAEPAPAVAVPGIEEAIPELRDVALLSRRPISRIKQPTTFCTGFRFRYPFGPPGAAITYAVDKPANHYLWPPKVDPSTPEGRRAIYQALRDAQQGGHFTMDGDKLLVLGGARVVPFRFTDERVGKEWPDRFLRVPRERFADFIKRQFTKTRAPAGPVEGSYALPLAPSSFFAALTGDDRVVILWIRRRSAEFQYEIGHYLLEPVAPAP